MANRLFRKGIVLGVIILFVEVNLITNTSGDTSVISDTIIVPDDYPTIQEAVNNANKGDTIYVRAGIYFEHVEVYTSLTIIGENKNTTIVDGNYEHHVFRVDASASNVQLSGFKIRNTGEGFSGIKIYSNNSIINDNIIEECGDGIAVVNSYNNIITENTIINNLFGVYISRSTNIEIRDNKIDNNFYGISFWNSTGINIKNNNIENNDYYGILQLWSPDNTINGNRIVSNGDIGIQMFSSDNNYIIENDIENNSLGGISLHKSSNNTILKNSIISNNNGTSLWFQSNNNEINENSFLSNGLFISLSYQNTVTKNTVNGEPLIYLEGTSDKNIDEDAGQVILVNCYNISVKNQILSNTTVGIELLSTNYCTIRDNKIYSNNLYGIYSEISDNNLLYLNEFEANGVNAWDNSANSWDNGSVGNYWDDYTGTDVDGNGIGDTPYQIPGGDNVDNYPLVIVLPVVEIIYPGENEYVGGIITIQGTAYIEDRTVELVEIQIDATDEDGWVAATGTISWSYVWDTATFDEGFHTIYARCLDDRGIHSPIKSVPVVVDNTPPAKVDIEKPREGFIHILDQWWLPIGTIVIGDITIQVDAADELSGIEEVMVYIDGEDYRTIKNDFTQYWEYVYTKKVLFKRATLYVEAKDGAGNIATSEEISFIEIL